MAPRELAELGSRLRRALLEAWPRFGATLDLYCAALQGAGHSARGAQQFGTLLACADLALFPAAVEPESDSLAEWAEALAPDRLAEVTRIRSNAEDCLDYLLQARPDEWLRGSKQTVAELIAEGVKVARDGQGGIEQAALAAGGLKLARDGQSGPAMWLAVGRSHRGTQMLFEGSKWAGRAGVDGGWAQALARLPGAVSSRKARIGGGRPIPCVYVPLSLVIEPAPAAGALAAEAAMADEFR
jgi:hypothetical protein